MLLRLSYSLLLLLSVMATAAAQDVPDLVTDRPDQTESALTVLPGWVQLEGGVTYGSAETLAPALLARIGLVRGLELRLGAGAGDLAAVVETVTLGGKLRLWNSLGGTEGALLVTTGFDTAARAEMVEARLSLATPLTGTLGLGCNVGAVWNWDAERFSALYTLALGFSIAEQIGAFAEFYGEDDFPAVDAGLTFLIAPNVQFDLSGGRSLRTDDYFVGFGASYRLPR